MSDVLSPLSKLRRQYATPSATAGNNLAAPSEPGTQQQHQQQQQEVPGQTQQPDEVQQPGQATFLQQEHAQQPTQQRDGAAGSPPAERAAKRQKLSNALWSDKMFEKASKVSTSSCHGCGNSVYTGTHAGKQGAGRSTLLGCITDLCTNADLT